MAMVRVVGGGSRGGGGRRETEAGQRCPLERQGSGL